MYVIDTNVASELMRPTPAAAVAKWSAERDAEELFLTAISEAELRYGIALLPPGQRKDRLRVAMNRWLDVGFDRRILPFDSSAAKHYSEIASRIRRDGRPISGADCQIAAIVRSRNAVLVTRNVRDFVEIDIEIVDPWNSE